MTAESSAKDDAQWRRRKAEIQRGIVRRVAGGASSADAVKCNDRAFEEWIAAGKPGDFLTFAHEKRLGV